MSKDRITDFSALEAIIGKVPGPLDLKVMDHLDTSALHWLSLSPLMFASFGNAGRVDITLAAGAPGFVSASDPKSLCVPLASLDEPDIVQAGDGFGSLFLLTGVNETLRVNGKVRAIGDEHIEVAVDECYLHCAKALMRSDFWTSEPRGDSAEEGAGHVADCRFMALASVSAEGRADVSPKGDPAGTLLQMQGDNWVYADRPGNRRVDSFRNILTQPKVAAVALITGSAQVALLYGEATIRTDHTLRQAFSVRDRVPKIVTEVENSRIVWKESAALKRAMPWAGGQPTPDIDAAAMFVKHIQQSKATGAGARIGRALMKVPGVMRKGLEADYKDNLY